MLRARVDKVLGHIQNQKVRLCSMCFRLLDTLASPIVLYFRWEHINILHIASLSEAKFDI